MRLRVTGLLAMGLIVAAGGTLRADDQKDIQGTWKIVKSLRGGKEMPAEERDKVSLEFKDGKVIVHEGAKDEPASFTLDVTTKPKSINIKPDKGADKEVFGIYELKGDSLKVCFGRDGTARPKEFASAEGSETMMIELKRDKK